MASAQLHVVVVLLFGVVIFAGAVMCECHDNLLRTGRFGGKVGLEFIIAVSFWGGRGGGWAVGGYLPPGGGRWVVPPTGGWAVGGGRWVVPPTGGWAVGGGQYSPPVPL